MLFLLISILLVALAVALSWCNKVNQPIRANWLPIVLLVGQALIIFYLMDLQRSIGCTTAFGPCYEQHDDLSYLQDSKILFGISSWVYWFYLGLLIIIRLVRFGIAAWKGIGSAKQ